MDKFQLAAVVDRLTYGDEKTFNASDAEALIAALPASNWRRFLPLFSFRASGVGKSVQGFAAGFGNVSVKDGGTSFEVDSRKAVRVGQWKLQRGWRSVHIEQVGSDTYDNAQSAMIVFSFRWRPIRMDLLVQQPSLKRDYGSVTVGKYVPWKTPVSQERAV